jgi:hypothetical protein
VLIRLTKKLEIKKYNMIIIITLSLVSIFTFLSSIHFYWAFGGKWASDGVLPMKSDNSTMALKPSVFATIVVAIGLLMMGLFIAIKGRFISIQLYNWIDNYGLYILCSIFFIRAIGEFKYLGFFKKVKHTKFAVLDTKYFSPLCLILSILIFVLSLLV